MNRAHQIKLNVAFDRDERSIGIDECDDGSDQRIIDVRQARCKDLNGISHALSPSQNLTTYWNSSFDVLEPNAQLNANMLVLRALLVRRVQP